MMLINFFIRAANLLFRFIIEMILAILGTLLYILPWLLRVAAILAWLTAAFIGLQTIQLIYSPFSPSIPLFVLQFFVIVSITALEIAAIKEGKQIWGGLVAGGLVVWSVSAAAIWLLNHWEYADLFFKTLPSVLFVTGTIFITVRMRARRHSHESK